MNSGLVQPMYKTPSASPSMIAQTGEKHSSAKPRRGFDGASVLEIIEDHDGGTDRAVYTVKLQTAVDVLHVFQKKSKTGIATSKRNMILFASA